MAVKEGRGVADAQAKTPANAWLMGAAAWAVPGAGHFLQGRWTRGLIVAAAICGMFIIGLIFGGHLFGLSGGNGEGTANLLQLPPTIANLGTGLLYLLCWASNTGFSDAAEYAKLPTFEYGNTF